MTSSFLQEQWLGDPVSAWAMAVGGAIVGYLVVHTLVRVLARRVTRIADRISNASLDVFVAVITATRDWIILLLALAVAGRFLTLPPAVAGHLNHAIELLLSIQVAFWLTRLISVVLAQRAKADGGQGNGVIFGVLGWIGRTFVWVLLLLMVLGSFGVNVNAFIASLGVGGIAVALAAQNILGDLFASVAIGLDRPFVVGDVIAFGDNSGTVQHVGIKSTRIRSTSGEELAIANTKLLQQLTRNYSRMEERRVAFSFSVAINTSRATAEQIVTRVRDVISATPGVRLGRGHMVGFGSYSLDFEFVYFVLDRSFETYRDIQQQINFSIMDVLQSLGAKLAVPVQVLHRGSDMDPRDDLVPIDTTSTPPA